MPANSSPRRKVHLNLKVDEDVAAYFRGKRQASRIFQQAVLPMLEGNGYSLTALEDRHQQLLEQDIRLHADIKIVEMQLEAARGQMAGAAIVDSLLQQFTDEWRLFRRGLDRSRIAVAKKKTMAVGKCEDFLVRAPMLRQRFPTPQSLLAYLERETGSL